MKGEQYIRCPRCELNYIKKKEKLCSVCQAELAADPNDVDDLELETCPICKTNFIRPDEIMCKQCIKERSLEDVIASGDEEWESYLNPDEENVNTDEETGDMASITDLDSTDIDDDMEIDDSDLPDMDEDMGFDDDDDDDDDFDDDDDDFDDDDDDDF